MKTKYLLLLTIILCGIKVFPQNIDTLKITKKILEKNIKPEYYNSLSKVKFTDSKKEISLDANIIIRKDSAIWVSLTALLGIEGARLLLTTDSIKMINKLENSWTSFSYTTLKEVFGIEVNYSQIQDLFLNNLFVYPNTQFDLNSLKNTKITQISEKILIEKGDSLNTENIPNYFSNYEVSTKIYKPQKIFIKESKTKRTLKIEYGIIKKFKKLQYPSNLLITALSEKEKTQISLTFEKVELNKARKINFNISPKLKKIDLFKKK